jgi:hypothetical protein
LVFQQIGDVVERGGNIGIRHGMPQNIDPGTIGP